MRYVGGKTRIANWIELNLLQFTQSAKLYLEPFMGSGAVLTKMVKHFPTCLAGDSHPDLVAMWQALQKGWQPPENISKEEYYAIKNYPSPDPLKGLVGFGSSFGGKFFGGYVDTVWDKRNLRQTKPYLKAAVNSVIRDANIIKDVTIQCCDYSNWKLDQPALIYCDPPYLNTLGYSGTDKFDWNRFELQAKAWARLGHTVIISESRHIDGTEIIAERKRKSFLRVAKGEENSVRTELLLMVKK